MIIQRHLEPKWRHFRCFNTAKLSPAFRLRLLDPGSTTQHMTYDKQHHLQVQLLTHRWGKVRYSEAQALSIGLHSQNLIRETALYCNGQMWMYARTVFPKKSLLGKAWRLRRLAEYPLGRVLFSDCNLSRSAFKLAILRPGHREYSDSVKSLTDKPDHLWARRSILWFQKKPLLLTEIFIPHPVLYEF